jgi:hypothetical protein
MKKLSFLFVVILSLSEASFSQPSFVKDSLDKYIEREMKRWNVPGSAVDIVKDGKVTSVTIRINDFVDMMDYEFIKE